MSQTKILRHVCIAVVLLLTYTEVEIEVLMMLVMKIRKTHHISAMAAPSRYKGVAYPNVGGNGVAACEERTQYNSGEIPNYEFDWVGIHTGHSDGCFKTVMYLMYSGV